MRTFSFVLMTIIISISSTLVGYCIGYKNGYIYALIDAMNNTKPEFILTETEDKQVVWKRNNDYKGISKAIRKGNLNE